MFKTGDKVRRKPEHHDEYWVGALGAVGLAPDAVLTVAHISGKALYPAEFASGGWFCSAFDLVAPAESNTAACQTANQHSASAIMQQGIDAMLDRAASRDAPDGERSMACAVNAFNAMFGKDLTEQQGWQFMELLKMSRSKGGAFRLDDYVDAAAYAALAGEAAAKTAQVQTESNQ